MCDSSATGSAALIEIREAAFSCDKKRAMTAKLPAGQEYEALLSEKLRCAGIAFFSEDKLREEGFFKTPDVKLEVRPHACPPSLTSNMACARARVCRSKFPDSQKICRNNCRAALS